MNCSSVILKVDDSKSNEVISLLDSIEFCEFQLYEKGNIILTIECENSDEEISKLYELQRIPDVLSVELAYSFCEDYLNVLQDNIEFQNDVPNVLNDDTLKAEDIKYSGQIKR